MRRDVNVFQLTGKKSLENLLEFIVTKMEGNTLKPKSKVNNIAYGSVPIATGGSNDRIDRLEKMMSTILYKIDDKTLPQNHPSQTFVHFAANQVMLKINVLNAGNVTFVEKYDTLPNFAKKISNILT